MKEDYIGKLIDSWELEESDLFSENEDDGTISYSNTINAFNGKEIRMSGIIQTNCDYRIQDITLHCEFLVGEDATYLKYAETDSDLYEDYFYDDLNDIMLRCSNCDDFAETFVDGDGDENAYCFTCLEDMENDEQSLDYYSDFSYAMEVVNGEIISLTSKFQNEILKKYLSLKNMTEDELADLFHRYEESDATITDDGYQYEFLSEFLGYDSDLNSFSLNGLDFLESQYGFDANTFLNNLGYKLDSNINYGAHGHDTTGVKFIK